VSDGVPVVGCSMGGVKTLETGCGGIRCGESGLVLVPWLGPGGLRGGWPLYR
jgi:hypothetical protein